MILHVAVQQFLGACFIEAYWVDDMNGKHFVARRKLPYQELLTPRTALRILRDEVPFLEALEATHPTV